MFHEKLNLEKIKDAIDALSDEEFHDLEVWIASQVDEDEDEDEESLDDIETEGNEYDPEWIDTPVGSKSFGGGWY